MKRLLLFLLVLSGLFAVQPASAVHTSSGFPVMSAPGMSLASQMTVSDFLAVDAKNLRTAEGKKIGWVKRAAIHLSQKKLAKKVKQGKISGLTPVSAVAATGNPNIHGLLSVIFAVAGLFIPYLGLPLIIAGLVLGIIGIKKDANPTLAIVGTVLSATILFLLLVVIAILASGGFFWF